MSIPIWFNNPLPLRFTDPGVVQDVTPGMAPVMGLPPSLLRAFETVPVETGGDRLFTKRFDTKYLFRADLLTWILVHLSGDYRIACYKERRMQNYESVYFDDPLLTCYQDHQRGKLPRRKIRFRRYLDSGNAFLEIKRKTNQKITNKWRRPLPPERVAALTLEPADLDFIHERIVDCRDRLDPRVVASFSRLTLKSIDSGERVTLDTNVTVTDPLTGAIRNLDGFTIAEVKQARISRQSPFRCLMRDAAVRPASFSKYCFGIYSFYPRVRHNRLKRNYRFLAKESRPEDALATPVYPG